MMSIYMDSLPSLFVKKYNATYSSFILYPTYILLLWLSGYRQIEGIESGTQERKADESKENPTLDNEGKSEIF